jgi:hypothetical protein
MRLSAFAPAFVPEAVRVLVKPVPPATPRLVKAGTESKERLVETNFGFVSSSADALRPNSHRFKAHVESGNRSQTRRGANPEK